MPVLSFEIQLVENSRNGFGLHVFNELNVFPVSRIFFPSAKNAVDSPSQISVACYSRTTVIYAINPLYIQCAQRECYYCLQVSRMNIGRSDLFYTISPVGSFPNISGNKKVRCLLYCKSYFPIYLIAQTISDKITVIPNKFSFDTLIANH